MRDAQLGGVVRHIRRMAASRSDPELIDRELLEAFALRRDQRAFAALVGRHGAMVLGVCRNVLHHEQDAEDAFQVTFLVLARHTATIRKRESLASWLHGVAYRTALTARRAAARRRQQEERFQTMAQTRSTSELGWQDVQGALQEELDRLPEPFRAAFILCCLECRSRSEAARELGLKEGTVASRVERARKCLQERLTRRGITLSAVLCAAAISRPSGAAVPERLVAAAVRNAADGTACVIPPTVAKLLEGVARTMCATKWKLSGLVLLAGALTVATLPGYYNTLAAKPVDPQQPAAAAGGPPQAGAGPAEAGETVRVRGRVLGLDGKPVAGAKVYLNTFGPLPRGYPVRATSDEGGRFEFGFTRPNRPIGPSDDPIGQVLATAESHGFDVWTVGAGDTEEITLRLVKDVPVSGRVLDPEGQPLAGVKLAVVSVSAPLEDLEAYLKAVRIGNYEPTFAKQWAGPLPAQQAVLTTGADGRFRLAGVGRERVIRLQLEGPGITSAYLNVMTRAGKEVTGHWRTVYGSSFDYLAVAARPVSGVVRDKDTGKPLAGVSVESHAAWGTDSPLCRVVTDQEGRYELLGLAKRPGGYGYHLKIKPVNGLHFERDVRLKDAPGLGRQVANIDIAQWLTVRGRVTDKAGKPVTGARVDYHPFYGNPHVNEKIAGDWRPRSETVTGADGSYALAAMPGPGILGVTAHVPDSYLPALVAPQEVQEAFKIDLEDKVSESALATASRGALFQYKYNALVLLQPDEKKHAKEALVKDVTLEPAHTVKIRLTDAAGQALTGVTVYDRQSQTILKTAELTVNIHPRATDIRQLAFYHQNKNLGAFSNELRGDTAGPLTIKLQPCGSVSGRVVDADGRPVAGARVWVWGQGMGPRISMTGGEQWLATDKDGRFRAEGLVPGQWYQVGDPAGRPGLSARLSVETGEHKDVGDIETK